MDEWNGERSKLLWIVLGIVIFIAGTIITRHIAGGFLALAAFILWRIGMLGIVISWIIRITKTAYNYLKAIIEVLKDEFFSKGEEALMLLNAKVDLILSFIFL